MAHKHALFPNDTFDAVVDSITTVSDATNFFPTLLIAPLPGETIELLRLQLTNKSGGIMIARLNKHSNIPAAGSAPTGAILYARARDLALEKELNVERAKLSILSVPTDNSKFTLDSLAAAAQDFLFKAGGGTDGTPANTFYVDTTLYNDREKLSKRLDEKIEASYATTKIHHGVPIRGEVDIWDDGGLAAFGTPFVAKSGGDSATSLAFVNRARLQRFSAAGGSPTNPTFSGGAPKHSALYDIPDATMFQDRFDQDAEQPLVAVGDLGESIGISFDGAYANTRIRATCRLGGTNR